MSETNCGKYRKRVTFFRQEKSSASSMSKSTQQLKEIKSVFASVKATGSAENYESDRLNNTVTYDVRTRYDPQLFDPTLIILWSNRRFEIRSVVDVREEHRELAFTCREILKAGDSHVRHTQLEY